MPADVVTYDSRSFRIDGKPFLILSGSVHYIRVHPSRWFDLFHTFIDAKLNTVETYVFWSAHEPRPGPESPCPETIPRPKEDEYIFSGRSDLFGFIAAAESHGLKVILRIGPYVCAEVSYGGFPFRLRDVPDISFRTFNAAFMDEVSTWVRFLADELRARRLLAGLGGPIILVQLENEYSMVSSAYGDAGARYLQWVADLQQELDFTVPGIMCYGAAAGVVETINAFYAHRELTPFRIRHPDQPPVWTECWTGWYDVWGAPHHTRRASDLCYAVARFFAEGGAGVNYYMWMGGTNWGRDGMYLQQTSYDYDAPVDEFYRHTSKSRLLAALHRVLVDRFAPALPTAELTQHESVLAGGPVTAFAWSGSLTFVCNDSAAAVAGDVVVDAPARTVLTYLMPKSVRIYDSASLALVFDTAAALPAADATSPVTPAPANSDAWTWLSAPEPVPTPATARAIAARTGAARALATAPAPPEQLALTHDASDYCFYTADFALPGGGADGGGDCAVEVELDAADFPVVFVDGARLAGEAAAPWEDRFSNKWTPHECDPEFAHRVTGAVRLRPAQRAAVVTVLVSALGLVKGDWQLGGKPMTAERKGLLADVRVRARGAEPWERVSPWTALAKTHGEAAGFPAGEFGAGAAGVRGAPAWWRTTLRVPAARSWALDLGGMGKGALWVNGTLLGRYWDVQGVRPKNGFLDGAPVKHAERGKPCQTRYHVPGWVAAPAGDGELCELRIVLLEELGNEPVDGESLLTVVVE